MVEIRAVVIQSGKEVLEYLFAAIAVVEGGVGLLHTLEK
jgi:hypothetical protein